MSIAIGVSVFFLLALLFVTGALSPTKEGFDAVPIQAFQPTTTPVGDDEGSQLSPAIALSPLSEKLAGVPTMSMEDAQKNWGKMTSETCYRTDIGETLKKTRNYDQRTNNYVRTHPDDCSAPNHEFLGTFYTPFEGVGRTPISGYTPSSNTNVLPVCSV